MTQPSTADPTTDARIWREHNQFRSDVHDQLEALHLANVRGDTADYLMSLDDLFTGVQTYRTFLSTGEMP